MIKHNVLKTNQFILLSFLLLLSSVVIAQDYIPQISAESSLQGGFGKNTPFWMSANKYGMYSIKNNQAFLRISAIKTVKSDTDYFYGIDVLNRFDGWNTPMLHQCYLGYKYRAITVYTGLKEDVFGNHFSDLSAGGALWSKNSQPMPVAYLGIPDYATIPFTFGRLETMGGILHGWLGTKDQYVQNSYLHYKYFLLRLRIISTLKFSFGLHHAVQWGGVSPTDGNLGSGFKEFRWAFSSSSSDGTIGPQGEKINAYGNSVSSYNAAIEYRFASFLVKMYYQNFCEDSNGRVVTFGWNYFHVGGDWKNRPDGIFGFLLKNSNEECMFQSFLFEYIHTSNQSGDPTKSGNDNYYNNYVYQTGWTYRQMTIGTPLITSPVYTNTISIVNNSVIAFHSGVKLRLNNDLLTCLATYSINKGLTIDQPRDIYTFPAAKKQFSSYIEYLHELQSRPNMFIGLEAGLDLGAMYGDNFGVRIKIKKVFN